VALLPPTLKRIHLGRQTIVICVTTLLAITTLLWPPPALATPRGYVSCRPPSFNPFDDTLSARHLSCRSARRVISAFFAKAQADGPRTHVRGFWCVDSVRAGQEPAVRCRRGKARVLYIGPQG
jgi:hypothetical protein